MITKTATQIRQRFRDMLKDDWWIFYRAGFRGKIILK